MKSFVGLFFLGLLAFYGLYIIVPTDNYVRIQHACSPINILGKPVQSGQRLTDDKGEASSISFFQKAEHKCQLYVYDLFYAEH